MPYANPADRRARDQANADRRRAKEKERYETDPEFREKKRQASRAHYEKNKEQQIEKARQRRLENPRVQWAHNLRSKYKITIEQWTEMLIAQSGRCAICLDPMLDPHVDHDHSTGRVRGLLCTNCNTGIGKFKDSPERLASAIRYLLQ